MGPGHNCGARALPAGLRLGPSASGSGLGSGPTAPSTEPGLWLVVGPRPAVVPGAQGFGAELRMRAGKRSRGAIIPQDAFE